MKPYEERLVYTRSEDGLELAGVVITPSKPPVLPTALVWIHGNTGAFYDYPYVTIGRELATMGYRFVCGNTRGHHISASLWNPRAERSFAGGSAWERLEEAPYDIAAWVKLALTAECRHAVLIGHSQGAGKVIHYQATRQDMRLGGIVAASPDLYGHWSAEFVAQAQALVAAGKDDTLLAPLDGVVWYRVSAGNLVSRAALLDQVYLRGDDAPHIAQIECPLLTFFGSRDIGGEAELEMLRRHAVRAARFDAHIIPDADHVYTERHSKVASLISSWVGGL